MKGFRRLIPYGFSLQRGPRFQRGGSRRHLLNAAVRLGIGLAIPGP
jgi:hypothetical protein